jgi:hypothetical protein
VNCLGEDRSSSWPLYPEQDSEAEREKIDDPQILLQKGFQSIENPVLRGSFPLLCVKDEEKNLKRNDHPLRGVATMIVKCRVIF